MSILTQMIKTINSKGVSEYTIYSDTLLALSSGNIVDISPNPRQVTNSGLTKTTQQDKECFYINGFGANYTSFSLASDFTIEANVLFTSTSDIIQLINYEVASTFGISPNSFTSWKDACYDYGTGLCIPTYLFSPSLTLNTWYNIRLVRSGKTFYHYLNRVLVNQIDVKNVYAITTNHFGWNQYHTSKGYFSHLIVSASSHLL